MTGGEDFDVVGAGFGPSGLALACAIEDLTESRGGQPAVGRVRFVEKAGDSAWHSEMLLAETDIQHHFLRDLATPRDPRSRFTFANYLKEKDRLYEFGELMLGAAGGAVSRVEWSDYLLWAADQLAAYVTYGVELLELRPVATGSHVDRVELLTSDGALTARAVVLSAGRRPSIPTELAGHLSATVFHSSRFRSSIAAFDRGASLRFAVIGSGESAIEILSVLHGAFPNSVMASIHRSLGFKHVDLCQFSNEIFHPAHVDVFHALDAEQRRAVLAEARPTNYGVVDAQAADTLYRKLYEDMVASVQRFTMWTSSRVVGLSTIAGAHRLELQDVRTGARSAVDADVVIVCTGYEEDVFPRVLEPLATLVATDDDGGPRLGRDYRVLTDEHLRAPIYLSGMSERTHGASDAASFSMMALRAERVLGSLREQLAF